MQTKITASKFGRAMEEALSDNIVSDNIEISETIESFINNHKCFLATKNINTNKDTEEATLEEEAYALLGKIFYMTYDPSKKSETEVMKIMNECQNMGFITSSFISLCNLSCKGTMDDVEDATEYKASMEKLIESTLEKMNNESSIQEMDSADAPERFSPEQQNEEENKKDIQLNIGQCRVM